MFGQRENIIGHGSSAKRQAVTDTWSNCNEKTSVVFTFYINWGSNPETWFTFDVQNTPAVSGVGTKLC